MTKVLVDQAQINELGVVSDESKAKLDTVFGLLQELKREIAAMNAATPDEVDLSPLLAKVNAVDTELGTMVPPPDDGTPPADTSTATPAPAAP